MPKQWLCVKGSDNPICCLGRGGAQIMMTPFFENEHKRAPAPEIADDIAVKKDCITIHGESPAPSETGRLSPGMVSNPDI